MTYIITHHGKWLSWNTMLSLNRWQRSALVAEAKQQYRAMLYAAGVQPMQRFELIVRYWSKIDADNLCNKYFIDTLRSEKLVVNDDKRYFDGVSVRPDPALKHNTYVITLVGS